MCPYLFNDSSVFHPANNRLETIDKLLPQIYDFGVILPVSPSRIPRTPGRGGKTVQDFADYLFQKSAREIDLQESFKKIR